MPSRDTLRSILFFLGLSLWTLLLITEVAGRIYHFDYTMPWPVHIVAIGISGAYYRDIPEYLIHKVREKMHTPK